MYPETIPPILLRDLRLTGHEVRNQVDSAEQRLEPIKVCQWICRAAEKLDMVRIVPTKGTDEQPNVQV
jgi:hypothetical protein